MPLQVIDIPRAARFAANAVDLDGKSRETQRKEELICHFYHFGIEGRVSIAQGFETELVVLPVAASLWPLISESRTNVVQSYRLG